VLRQFRLSPTLNLGFSNFIVYVFWFLVCNAATQLATQLPQRRIQVVRSNKVARKRLTESNGTPMLDSVFFGFWFVRLPHS